MLSLLLHYLLTNAVAKGILDESRTTLDLWKTAEWSLCVLALKLMATVIDSSLTLINILVKKSEIYCNAENYYYIVITKFKFDILEQISDKQSSSSPTDLCSCCYQWVHSQSRSWPLSGNGTSPLCWYTALPHDSCWHPANTRWYLRGFECRTFVIVNFYGLCRYSCFFKWKHFQFNVRGRHTLAGLFIWFEFVAVETGARVIAHAALCAPPWENSHRNPAQRSLF